jgi:predicted transcriptional regulator
MAEEKKEKEVNVRRSDSPSSADTELITRAGKRIRVTDEQFAILLEKAGGFKTRVAKQLGITLSAVCHRIKRSEYLREQCKSIEETVLDMAEAALLKAVNEGEAWAITFVLKCKGKKRGWVERSELAFANAEELPPPITISFNNPEFIAQETERQKKEFAETIDVAIEDFKVESKTAQDTTESIVNESRDDGKGETKPTEEMQQAADVDQQLSVPPLPPPPRPLRPSEVAALKRQQAGETNGKYIPTARKFKPKHRPIF